VKLNKSPQREHVLPNRVFLFLLMSVGKLKERNPVPLKPSWHKGEVEVNLNQHTAPALEEGGSLAPLPDCLPVVNMLRWASGAGLGVSGNSRLNGVRTSSPQSRGMEVNRIR
jgi:hypothetical protein